MQLATGVLVVIGAGHVVVFQPLPDVGPEALHTETGALVVTIAAGQVVVVKLLPALGVPTGVQLATGTLTVALAEHAVVAIQFGLVPALPLVQVAAGCKVVVTGVAHTRPV